MPAVRRSYADPTGAVYQTADGYVRHLDNSVAERMASLLGTPFFRTATAEYILPEATFEAGPPARITTQPVGRLTYPCEWSPRQLIAAARLTVDLARRAFADGYVLKDAQAKNVVFQHSRPVFVDLGSFEEWSGEPAWRARGQFDRHFLLPLLAFCHRGQLPSAQHAASPDGLSPVSARRLLGMKAWSGLLEIETCALPSRSRASGAPSHPRRIDAAVARSTYASLLNHTAALVARIERQLASVPSSHWGGYGDGGFHYGTEDLLEKQARVEAWLAAIRPRIVIDIGANTGTFSFIAARSGAEVVAVESDAAALDQLFLAVSHANARITPMLMDFCAPTPSAGWEAQEFSSFDQRFGKTADTALALAVAHHIAVRGYGYDPFMTALARLTTKHVIVEFIDPADDMFGAMLATRGLSPEPYSRDRFMAAFHRHFREVGRHEIKKGMRLLLQGELHG